MRKMILTLALVLFAASTMAQPLQDFDFSSEYRLSDGGDVSVTGGETVRGIVSFENQVERDLPLVVKLEVSSDEMRVTGEEFENLDVTVLSSNLSDDERPSEDLFAYPENIEEGEIPLFQFDPGNRVNQLECSVLSPSRNSSVYRCLSEDEELVSATDSRSAFNNVTVEASAVPNIAPGSYDFELKFLSQVGVGTETVSETVNASEPDKVSTPENQSSVTVNSSAEANVTVQQVTELSDPNTDTEEFVGGISVDVSNSSGQVDSSGVVTIGYEDDALDSEDVNVYFYNDTGAANQWVNVGGTQYTNNNTVSEEVDHFSTYGAFVEPQQADPTDTDDGGGDVIPFNPAEDEEENESDTQEQNEESSEQDDSSGDQQEDNTQQDGSSDQDDTGVEDSEQDTEDQTDSQQTPDTPTGQFFTSDTGIASGLLILLVVLVVYLEYTGRIELRELKEVIKQKTSS